MLAYLKTQFGEENIIEPRVSGHDLLENAKIVGCFTNSEMGLAALAKGKTTYLLNDQREQYTYSAIYNAVSLAGLCQLIGLNEFFRVNHLGLFRAPRLTHKSMLMVFLKDTRI